MWNWQWFIGYAIKSTVKIDHWNEWMRLELNFKLPFKDADHTVKKKAARRQKCLQVVNTREGHPEHKELPQFRNVEAWSANGKGLGRIVTQRKYRHGRQVHKGCSLSRSIREMQIKATMKHNLLWFHFCCCNKLPRQDANQETKGWL